MAKILQMDQAEFDRWSAGRPAAIQEVAKLLPPDRLYRLKSSGHRVFIYSYFEDGTLSVVVSGRFNLIPFERRVFGVPAADLTECDLPAEDEPVGVTMTQAETLDFINKERAKLGHGPLTAEQLGNHEVRH